VLLVDVKSTDMGHMEMLDVKLGKTNLDKDGELCWTNYFEVNFSMN
jgi:hypothetical protein